MTPPGDWCVPEGICAESSAGQNEKDPVNESVWRLGGTNSVGFASLAIRPMSSSMLVKGEDAVDSRGWGRGTSIPVDELTLTSNPSTQSLKRTDTSLSSKTALDYIKYFSIKYIYDKRACRAPP